MASSQLSRQSALKTGLAAIAAPMFIPSRVFGANERLNIGAIGVGGRQALLVHITQCND